MLRNKSWQFLTRLVQNLTLCNDCNLIPSAHRTQRVVLSKRSLDIHITLEFKLLLVRGERWLYDAQLLPRVVAGTQTCTGLKLSTPGFRGECANQYTTITSLDLQLLNFAYKRLLNKPYENEVTLTGQNPPLKCCQPLELLTYFEKGI